MSDFSRAVLTGRAEGPVTSGHVARDGRAAQRCPYGGFPAYESEHGKLLVMENMVVSTPSASHPPLLLPFSYNRTAARAPDEGLAALHDDPDAIWSWRPLLYQFNMFEDQRLGSQQELEYRIGLSEVHSEKVELWARVYELGRQMFEEERAKRGGKLRKNARKRTERRFAETALPMLRDRTETLPFVAARERADALLWELLDGQQRLDLLARRAFYVRGRINRLYEVRVSNGFAIVDPVTRDESVSLCLHPERWMPHADVAIATKLGIEAGQETEAELLEAANPTVVAHRRRSTADERAARWLERRFLGC